MRNDVKLVMSNANMFEQQRKAVELREHDKYRLCLKERPCNMIFINEIEEPPHTHIANDDCCMETGFECETVRKLQDNKRL